VTASPNARSDGTTAKRDADGSGFRRELVAGVRLVDLLALAAVPVVLGAVFALPESTRRSLAFAYTDPTVRTAFTAHYVHLDVDHLAGNVAGYVVLAGVGYALAVLAGCRRFFMVALATFLAAFPVVLSALNLAVPRNAISLDSPGSTWRSPACSRFYWESTPANGSFRRRRYARSPRSSSRSSAGWRFWRCRSRPGVSTNRTRTRWTRATAVAGILLGLLYASSTGVRIRRALRDGGSGGDLEPRLRRPVRHRRRSGRRLPGCRVPRRSDGTRQRSKSVRSPVWVLSRVHRALHPARGRDVRGVNCPSVPLAAPRPTASHRSPPRCPEPRVYNASMTFSD